MASNRASGWGATGTAQLEIVNVTPPCKTDNKGAAVVNNYRLTATELMSGEGNDTIATQLTLLLAENSEGKIYSGTTVPYFTDSSDQGRQTTFVDAINVFQVGPLTSQSDVLTIDLYRVELARVDAEGSSANSKAVLVKQLRTDGVKMEMKKGESQTVYRTDSGKETRSIVLKY